VRYFHEGYLHERDVIERLEAAGVPVLNRQRELVAEWDERFRGHIDGEVDGDLLEIKGLEDGQALDNVRKMGPRSRDRSQVQAYMRYGEYYRALIVYKVRSNGEMWVCWLRRDDEMGEEIERKARMVLQAVDDDQAPECTCGYCAR
jgi:hypothetical protein